MIRMKQGVQWTLLFLAIVSLAIFITINSMWLYWLNVVLGDLSRVVGLSTGRIMDNYGQLLSYLQLPWIHHLGMMDFPTSPSGRQHFSDVKNLFLFNNTVLIVTVVPAWRFLRRLWRTNQVWRLIRPFQVAAVVPILAGMMMAINFNQFFIAFHKTLFRNSDWLFNPQFDPIILVLPESFFSQCFVFAFLLFELVMIWGIWSGKESFNQL